jgi:hypothetical protein
MPYCKLKLGLAQHRIHGQKIIYDTTAIQLECYIVSKGITERNSKAMKLFSINFMNKLIKFSRPMNTKQFIPPPPPPPPPPPTTTTKLSY